MANVENEERGERGANDSMLECEVKKLFVERGARVWKWVKREAEHLDDTPEIRCMHCHGRVRLHRQRVAHGPRAHVEHLSRADSEHCRGGHHFTGAHRMSSEPVE